jgi:GT2 family glycosyltransferase
MASPADRVPPLPDPGPDFLARILEAAPVWALTSEQRELRLSLIRGLLGQATARPDCLAAAQSLLALAFQEEPFDAETAALLEAVQAAHPFLPAKAAALLRLLRAAPALAPDDVRFEDIRASGDTDLVVRYLDIAAKDRRAGLARLAPAFVSLCRLPDPEIAASLLAAFAPGLPPPLFARLRAELAFLRLPPGQALPLVEDLDRDVWGLFSALAACRLRSRLGDRDGALLACLALRRALPHHVNLTLVAHDLAFVRSKPARPAPDTAAVCLYSMNKAELLRECLTHLAGTDLGGNLVAILDNGSTDHTARVIDEVSGLFSPGRFLSVRLPVNVGAPGARNWLLSLSEVKARSFVAFLDDDAFPGPDWLSRLLDTAGRFPQAGAVGCSIVDRSAPGDHQSADYNLFPPHMGQSSLPEVTERLFVCDACRLLPDFGQFAYVRPCLSVSGCCHLLSRAAIEAAGPFDIRYNPTQFDDLERDIRSWLAGYPAVYDGTVRVAHQQASSLAKAKTQAQVAHILGNKIKLETSLADADADRLWRENLETLGRDLLEKAARLQGMG